MKKLSSKQFRQERKKFWELKKHKYLPESLLIGGNESTAMFNIAGMQQLIPYLSGKEHQLGKRLFNIQKCIRTVDIDEVGDASHLTFFEMMGNWSLGDYFKEEAIKWSWEFLVDVLGFEKENLAVTVFEGNNESPKDIQTANYWKEIGISEDKISYMSAKNNRRSPGAVGPCGPDTEIFYRTGKENLPSKKSNPKSDENNRLEIWNNVFMEFYCNENGKLSKLKNQNVDTGMGFERMCKILQNKETIFETDLFLPLIELIEKYVGLKYIGNEKRFRIIADHIRTVFFMIKNGILISNEGRGYVIRRLVRRMYYNFVLMKEINESEFKSFLKDIGNEINKIFEETENIENFVNVMTKEINQFQKTLKNGQKMMKYLCEKKSAGNIISGEDMFKLYDTFGFPLELTCELANEKGIKTDLKGFHKEIQKQQQKSRQSGKDMFKQGIDWGKYLQGIPQTKFIGYGDDWKNLKGMESKLLKDFVVDGQRIFVFDQTPFYAECGGQTGDKGIVILDNGEKVEIVDVKKYEGIFLHFAKR
ncbi:MAG: alanine--tRNA ligase [Candidatus Absconditabacterales bacterium]